MKVITCLLCDSANYTEDKRLNVLGGGITSIRAQRFPIACPLSLVVRIMFEHGEDGAHEITVRAIDPDGKDLLPPFRANVTMPPGRHAHNMIFNVHPLTFQRPGTHRFDVFVDKTLLHSEDVETGLMEPENKNTQGTNHNSM